MKSLRAKVMVPLADLTTLISSGSTPKGGAEIYLREGPVMLVRSQNVRMNRLDLEDVAFITNEIDSGMTRSRVQCGDVLLNITGASIGRVAVFEQQGLRANVNQHVCIIRPKPDSLLSRYLAHFISTSHFQAEIDRLQRGGTRQALTFGQIADFSIPLPPLDEQKRIADILDRAEGLRASRRAALALLDTLAQAIFTEMFGDPARNTKQLPTCRLGDLGAWQSGGTPPRSRTDYFVGTVPWFSSGELNEMYVSDSTEQLSVAALRETSAKPVAKGSLMLGMYDTAALKASIPTVDCSCNQAVAFAALNSQSAEAVYVYSAIQIGREHFRRLQRGVRQKNLNLSMVRDIQIPLPPLPLQQEFARRLAAVEGLRASQRASLTKLDELFASLQHRAFRGEL